MKGVVVTPKSEMYIHDFDEPIFETVGKVVGGLIENTKPMFLPPPYCMIVNEEFLLHQLDMNFTGCLLYGTNIHGYPIAGNIVFMKLEDTEEGPDFAGLTENEVFRLCQYIAHVTRGKVRKIADHN